jgi:hypothetical protein
MTSERDKPETPEAFFASVARLVNDGNWAEAVVKLTAEVIALHVRIMKLEKQASDSRGQYPDPHEAGYNDRRH